jgi:type IV pilus assembly protein PilM
MFFRSRSIIGLDIGSSSIKVVELEKGTHGHVLRRFGYAPLPPEAIVQGSFMNAPAISGAIREACQAARIRSKDVATSVSGHSVIVKNITLPAQSESELDETIRWEAEQYIPFDINEVNLDYQILRPETADGQMDVLLVAAKKELIHDYTSVVQDAGLNLAILDVDAFALANLYEYTYQPGPDTAVALVDIGASVISIAVMNGGLPAFTRDISAGGNQYTEGIQKTLSITFEEAEAIKVGGRGSEDSRDVVPQEVEEAMREVSETVLGEVQRSLDFYRATTSSNSIQRVILCGASARVPGLDRMFQERIELPVEIVDPFARIKVATGAGGEEQLRDAAPGLCVALGLGIRGRA